VLLKAIDADGWVILRARCSGARRRSSSRGHVSLRNPALVAVACALIVSMVAAPARAQGPTVSPQKAAEVKAGRRMMVVGGLLVVGGLAVLPITAGAEDRVGVPAIATSMGMVGGGAALAWLGARKARRGVRPQLTFGVTAGTVTGAFFRRSW